MQTHELATGLLSRSWKIIIVTFLTVLWSAQLNLRRCLPLLSSKCFISSQSPRFNHLLQRPAATCAHSTFCHIWRKLKFLIFLLAMSMMVTLALRCHSHTSQTLPNSLLLSCIFWQCQTFCFTRIVLTLRVLLLTITSTREVVKSLAKEVR